MVTRTPIRNNAVGNGAAEEIVGTNTDRRYLRLRNVGAVNVAYGNTSAVTATTGDILRPGDILEEVDCASPIWAIAVSGSGDLAGVEHIQASVDAG